MINKFKKWADFNITLKVGQCQDTTKNSEINPKNLANHYLYIILIFLAVMTCFWNTPTFFFSYLFYITFILIQLLLLLFNKYR